MKSGAALQTLSFQILQEIKLHRWFKSYTDFAILFSYWPSIPDTNTSLGPPIPPNVSFYNCKTHLGKFAWTNLIKRFDIGV